MEKDVFKFKDFMTGENPELESKINNLIKEGFFDDEDESEEPEEVIDQNFNPYKIGTEEEEEESYAKDDDFDLDSEDIDDKGTPYIEDEDELEDLEDLDESKSESEDYYKLFKDKAEDFVCDIAVEGVNQADTEVRLIIESEDWTLMFVGEIKKGKCIIPIKKLNIFNEGQTGNIKLEVNADGNLFTPWEDKFVVKMSKKVTVKLNESRSQKPSKPAKKSLGVKVNVRR